MTIQQGLSFAILVGMLVLFASERWRFDIVALISLLTAVACGIVPAEKAFSGFSNQLLPLIASVLVVSAAIGKSGVIEILLRPVGRHLRTTGLQVLVLTTAVGLLSAIVKNVGALAIFLPIAMQLATRNDRSPSTLLMPLSFASLLGGMMTLIGTSPNLIVASIRQQLYGEPFRMFDFLPVGLMLTFVGVAYLSIAWRLLPHDRQSQDLAGSLFHVGDYLTEVRVPPASPYVGRTVAELETLGDGDMTITTIFRELYRRYIPSSDWTIYADDVLVLRCDPHVLERVVAEAGLELVGDKEIDEKALQTADVITTEAVVTARSPMIGTTLVELRLRERYAVSVLAVSQTGRAARARLRRVKFQLGDLLVLHGKASRMSDTLSALGLLPLAERRLSLGRPRKAVLSVLLLLAAVVLAATEVVPAAIAFTGAATLIAVFRILTLREIYENIEWPILILLGCLIPVGEAVRDTGGTDLIAGWLSHLALFLPSWGILAAVIVITMLVTPIMHHAAAVIVMAPIAVGLASRLGLQADPFLMAVAVGAGSDFLTPIGHQCNTLVMGPGGYRFGDYWRLGLPLSILVVLVATTLIIFFWPLHS